MIKITLKDGNVLEFEKGTTILRITKSISEGLARVATCAEINGKIVDLRYEINEDCKLIIHTFDSDVQGKKAYWHTTSHILAQAVKRLFPDVKLAIGPAIDEGLYYDFDIDKPFTDEDKANIELEMKKIIKENLTIEKFTLEKDKALELMKDEPYKIELINDLESGELINFYKQGEFIDLCAGPHLESTGKIKSVKILSSSGAYWKGNEKNKMLQRIYAISFPKSSQLTEYLNFLEEAKKRDHRKLGKELDLYCNSDYVGPGLPLYTPRAVAMKDELQKTVEKICKEHGFQKVSCPALANISLFETSGHAAKFNDELFRVYSPKGHEFVLKPVQCPHHTQIYASKIRSYRDLPIRYMESDKQYRAELQGSVSGMSRVYAITVEDGHSFCRVDQVKQEIINICNIIKEFYTKVGLWGKQWVSLSVRDDAHKEKYIGSEEDWEICENMLQEVSDELGLNAKRCEGEAALYGPKLDFMFKDAMGREIQIPTVQLDFATPKRFNLTYIDSNGEKQNPVMVHRAILGSYERFFVLMLEHFAGIFPTWLAPTQVKVIPVSEENQGEYALEVQRTLLENDIRAEVDLRNEKLGYRLREAQTMKVPYTIILGDKEKESNTISYRLHGKQETTTVSLNEFLKIILKEIKNQDGIKE